jgi:hypothetical protein
VSVPRINDRHAWLKTRVAFLEAELERTEDPATRSLIETELDFLIPELEDAKRNRRLWSLIGWPLRRE